MWYVLLVFILSCTVGCATIWNGTTQKVPILVPDGTIVTDTNGRSIPINDGYERFPKSITLKRNKNYILNFDYKGSRVTVDIPKTMNGWWLLGDILCYIIPSFVDLATGAWFTFEGIRIAFPDSTNEGGIAAVSSYIDDRKGSEIHLPKEKLGLTALLGIGFAGPVGGDQAYLFFFGNSYSYGLGYEIVKDLHIFGDFTSSSIIDVHPRNSAYTSEPLITTYEAGARYYPTDALYLGASIGFAKIDTDSVKHHQAGSGVDQVLPPAYATIPVGSIAFGHAGSIGFIEFRYKLGLHGFDLSSGERGSLHSFIVRYGFNIEF